MIAAVNGVAVGGGLEMALACDIIVAADHARLGLPEPRVGLFAGAGGIHRLARQVPFKLAMGLLLTGRLIQARRGIPDRARQRGRAARRADADRRAVGGGDPRVLAAAASG